MTANRDFDGQVGIVTGAGRGIGRAVALYLARCGASLVINELDEAVGIDTVIAIEQLGGNATLLVGSVAESSTATGLVGQAHDAYGRLDIVVNNAGGHAAGPLVALTEEQITAVIGTHLMGSIFLSRAALPAMKQQGYGRIVNMSSSAGAFGLPQASVYAAAKAGVVGFTKALAQEVGGSGIAVNAVAPLADTTLAAGFFDAYPHLNRSLYRAELVAPAVAYLCSRGCALRGELLSVAAGRVARIFTATAPGLLDTAADHHDIGRQLAAILATDHFVIPTSALDEFLMIEV
jgi:NAD(P)-dependent dehydrogenase (short-subunit alcohol dehydrogenase family)